MITISYILTCCKIIKIDIENDKNVHKILTGNKSKWWKSEHIFLKGSIDVPLLEPFGALIHCVKSSHTNVKNFWRCTVILNNTNKTNWSSKHDHSTIPQNRIWTSFENIKLLFPSLIINVCTTMFCFSLFWRFSLSSYSTCFLYLKQTENVSNRITSNMWS